MDDCGIEFVAFRQVIFEIGPGSEVFGTEGTLVVTSLGVEEDVKLQVAIAGAGKGTMGAAETWQDWRHTLVGSGDEMLFIF